MVDVGIKGFSRMKYDCSLDSNVFFMGVASISESLWGVATQIYPKGCAPRTPTPSPLTGPSPTTRLRHWLNDDSLSV